MNDNKVTKWFGTYTAYLLFLWIILTAFNINKAYHIDDTFHMEAAKLLIQHPLKPMSGYINWDDSPAPMYTANQPPLFFYIIAGYQVLFGESEVANHLLLSVFTFLSLLIFYRLLQFFEVKNKRTLLTIFAFCPAFVINQNLMTDIPLLTISLGIIFFLLKGQQDGKFKNYVFSALLLSAGLMIKYSLLPVFLVLLLSIVLSGNYKKVIVLGIPILVLTLWSIWNTFEFGAIHLFTRPKSEFEFNRIWSFLGTIGSMATFSIIFLYYFFPKKVIQYLFIIGTVLFFTAVPFVFFGAIDEFYFNRLLKIVFLGNGLLLLGLILIEAVQSLLKEQWDYFKTPKFTLALYIFGISAFIALFAPFNATRHILLLVPFILLIGHTKFETASKALNYGVVSLTIILGILLGISDWVYADFYRKSANELDVSGKKVWSAGHWGWQWYSQQAGMKIYSKDDELAIRNGDYLVYPKDMSIQKINPKIELEVKDMIIGEPNFLTFFSGKQFGSMYMSYTRKPAWSLSNIPIDTIMICEVKKELGFPEVIDQLKSDTEKLEALKKKAAANEITLDSMVVVEANRLISKYRKN